MSAPAPAAQRQDTPAPASREAIILFDDVPQAAELAAAWATEGRAVLLLDARHQGLATAADWLAAQAAAGGRLDSVHLVSHGSAGAVQFGIDRLATDGLQAYQADLARLGQALRDGGDLLWYGCDLAAGTRGEALLDQLAAATGRDSAASVDRTGSAELGGDWVLERSLGAIEARTLQWSGAGIALSTTANFDDQGSDTVWNNQSYQGLVWNGFDVYASGGTGVGGTSELIFSDSSQVASIAISSGVFTPVSIAAYIWMGGDATITFRGYVGGTQVASVDYTLPSSGGSNPNTLYTFGAGFANITRLEIDPTTNGNNAGGFDNFVFDLDTTPPTVSSVTSSTANGSYGVGQVIAITVNFSESVVVTGIPTLALNSGGSASYASGSGSSALVFNYTVAAGHSSADLDYNATNSLALAGGTIKDASGNNATLTLPTPGAANSLGNNKALVVDGSAPSVSSVAVPSNGTYTIGQHLDFTVSFDQNVTVNTGGGTPYIGLTLDTGGSVQAAYVSGSGTSTLVFRYTVASGNLDANGVTLAGSITANGGTLRDGASNNAALTLNSVGSTAGVLVDGVAPSVSSINRVSASLTNGTSVDYTVSFAEAVSGVDASDFTLTSTGSASGAIASVSAVNSSTYTVTVNTLSGDGTLRLDLKGSGTAIADAAGNAIGAGYTSGQTYTLDHSAPVVSSVAVPSNATYLAGQHLDFTVNFDQAVTVNTGGGTPYIGLTLDTGGSVQAAYLSGSGTSALVFRYTVTSGNLDANGVTLAGSITANGGTLRDAATNGATLTLNSVGSTAGVLVDAVVPTVSSVGVPANATYAAGQALDFTVNFSEAVTVNTGGGTPYIALTLDTGGTAYANYHAGSGSSAIVFRYTVASGTLDGTGVAVASAIQANGATLRDGSGNNATLTLNGMAGTSSVLVDGVAPTVSSITRAGSTPTAATSVNYTVSFGEAVSGVDASDFTLTTTGTASGSIASVSVVNSSTYTVTVNTLSGDGTLRLDLKGSGTGIGDLPGNAIGSGYTSGQTYTLDNTAPQVTSVGVPANATYVTGQNLDFTVNFAEAVTVDTAGGTPRLALTLNTGGIVHASYLSGSGTSALVFRYTVASGNADADGVAVSGSLDANGGTLRDAVGNNATLTLNSVGSTANVLVDATPPTVNSVSVPGNGTYVAGSNLDITIHWSENVTVNTGGGTPRITLTLDTGGTVYANYLSGSTTTSSVFRYTVASGQLDANGITVGALGANGGTLRDAAGNDATLTLNSVASTSSVLVDAVAPTVSSIARVGTALTSASSVSYTVSFSEAVSGVDTADFTLTSTGTAAGTLASVAAVNASTYTVTVNNLGGDGTLRLDLKNAGTGIADTPGNAIAGGFTGGQTFTLDHTAPTVNSVAVPANAVYGAGQALDFTVSFNETLTVNTAGGTPRLALSLDTGGTVYASYLSGSGSATLTFRYTVVAGNGDANGITMGALGANGGTLRDAAGNDATLTLNGVGSTAGVQVDTVTPAVTGVAVPAAGTYGAGSVLTFDVQFNEAITVNTAGGTPKLQLNFDGPYSGQASYVGGSGTSTLQFSYTVKAGDLDANGISLGALQPLGATLRDGSGNDAALTLVNVGSTAGIRLDTQAPVVLASTPEGASPTGAGTASFQLRFSEVVTGVDAGDFGLATTGSARGTITSISSGDGRLYTVLVDQLAGEGALRLDLKAFNTNIADLTGNALAGGYSGGGSLLLDHQAPALGSVAVPAAGLYRAGQVLSFQVHFSEPVLVDTTSGRPSLALSLQSGGASAAYVGGSGSQTLQFQYTVRDGDLDRFGPSLLRLALGGASIRDQAGNDAGLGLVNVGSMAGVVVETAVDPEPPAPVTGQLRLPAAGLYGLDDAIDLVIEYTQPVSVSGQPTLALTLDGGRTVQAAYAAGSGGTQLSFRYVVAEGDLAAAGLAAAAALDLHGGALRDALGREVGSGFGGAGTAAGVRLDGVAPQATSLGEPANGIRDAGDPLVFTLGFDESVSLDTGAGTPALQFALGDQPLLASYVSGSGGRTLQFSATVPDGVDEGDLLSFVGLALHGARITDAAGNAAASGLPPAPALAGIRFGDGDGIAGAVENLVPTPGHAGEFGDGNADGTPDRLQPQVVSGPVELFGRPADTFATLTGTSPGMALHAVAVLPVPTGLGPEIVVPFGLFGFSATLAESGTRQDFSIFVPAQHGVNGFWLADPAAGWLLGQASGTLQGGQLRFDFSVVDGGAMDLDGRANGEIVLQGGAAFVPLVGSAALPPGEDPGGSSG